MCSSDQVKVFTFHEITVWTYSRRDLRLTKCLPWPWGGRKCLQENRVTSVTSNRSVTALIDWRSWQAAPEFAPLLVWQWRGENGRYRCWPQAGRLLNKTVHEVINLTVKLTHQVTLQELSKTKSNRKSYHSQWAREQTGNIFSSCVNNRRKVQSCGDKVEMF